jgi:hypothetical protein
VSKKVNVQFEGKTVPAVDLEFEAGHEPWTVYKLEDGSILKFKQALAKVSRLTENFKEDGEPIYIFQVGTMTHVDASEDVKKKVG